MKFEDFQAERELWSSHMEEIHTQQVATVKEVMKQEAEGVTQKVDNLLSMLKQHMATCEARFQRTESATNAQLRQQGLEIEGARAQLQELFEGGQGRDQVEEYTQVCGMLEGIQDDQKSLRRDVSLQIEELVAKTLMAQTEHQATAEAARARDSLLGDLHNKVVGLEQRLEGHIGQVVTLEQVDNLLTMLKQHMATCEARFQRTESATDAQLRQQGLEIEGARAQLQDLEGRQGRDQVEEYTQVCGMLEGIQDDQRSLRRDVSLQIEELVAKTLMAQTERQAMAEAARTRDSLLDDLHNKVFGLEQRWEGHIGQVVTLEQRFNGHVGEVESRFAQHSRDLQQQSMLMQQRTMVDPKSLHQGLDRVEADMRSQMEAATQGHERAIKDLRGSATAHAQTTDQLNRKLLDLEAVIQTSIHNQTSVQKILKQESMTMHDLRQSLTNQSDQTHQFGLQLQHLDARMDSLARVVQPDSARDLTEERLNRAEGDIRHLSLFLSEVDNKEAKFLHALRAESEQRALQISDLQQYLNQGLAQARAIQELHHEVAVTDAALAREAELERAAQLSGGIVVADDRFVQLKEWVNVELGSLRRQQQENFQRGPSPPLYPIPKRGQEDRAGAAQLADLERRLDKLCLQAESHSAVLAHLGSVEQGVASQQPCRDGANPEVPATIARIEDQHAQQTRALAEANAGLNERMRALEEREGGAGPEVVGTINRIEEQHTQQVKTLNTRLRALEDREEQYTPQVKSLSSRMRTLEEREASDKIIHLNLAELRDQRDRDAEKLAEVRRELAAMAAARSSETMEQSVGVKKDLQSHRQSLTELEKELHRNCSDVRTAWSTALAAEHERWVQADRDVRAELLREINAEKRKRVEELSQQRQDFMRAMREWHERMRDVAAMTLPDRFDANTVMPTEVLDKQPGEAVPYDRYAALAVEENREQGWFWGSNHERESATSERELEKRLGDHQTSHESYPWHRHHSHRGQIPAASGPQPAALWGEQEAEWQMEDKVPREAVRVGRPEQQPPSPRPRSPDCSGGGAAGHEYDGGPPPESRGSKGWISRLFR